MLRCGARCLVTFCFSLFGVLGGTFVLRGFGRDNLGFEDERVCFFVVYVIHVASANGRVHGQVNYCRCLVLLPGSQLPTNFSRTQSFSTMYRVSRLVATSSRFARGTIKATNRFTAIVRAYQKHITQGLTRYFVISNFFWHLAFDYGFLDTGFSLFFTFRRELFHRVILLLASWATFQAISTFRILLRQF